jgi:cardiolipin synthase
VFFLDPIFSSLEHFEWSLPVLGWLGVLASLLASVHVILRKRDSRSAIAWIGLILLSPFVGAFLYLLLGVNRIRRRAQAMRPRNGLPQRESLGENIGIESAGLLRLGDVVTGTAAVSGNRIRPLPNGEVAYPAMLEAIEKARYTVTLATYIFDRDSVGMRFAEVLERAVQRGVQVRVLIDDIGSRYSFRKMSSELKRRGVPVARFLPIFQPRSFFFLNLRLHRKILVVDGRVAFTGGMNIRDKHLVSQAGSEAVQDMHFEVVGPVVRDLQQVFTDDWSFTTKENLRGEGWFPPLFEEGTVLARCVDDGPDFHLENARWILLGAISSAKKRLRIMTPYFLPDATLITALNTAALRGIQVQILLPQQNNLPWVNWASLGTIGQVVERGCELYFSPPPFDHSKLMTVDDGWAFFGSVNWDARSLRLNFELNVEAYDTAFVKQINTHIENKIQTARRMAAEELANRPLPTRIRDGVARLFSPYL